MKRMIRQRLNNLRSAIVRTTVGFPIVRLRCLVTGLAVAISLLGGMGGLSNLASAATDPGRNVPQYVLNVSLDIAASKLTGVAVVHVSAPRKFTFTIGHLHVREVLVDGVRLNVSTEEVLQVYPKESVTIGYEKKLGTSDESVVDERGIALTSAWYPIPDVFCLYRLTALLPKGYEAVSEAETIVRRSIGDQTEFRFDFPYPIDVGDGISLVASDRFIVAGERHRHVWLYAYFLKEDAHLAPKYLSAAKNYIAAYEKKLTPFPYRRFAIVESFLPSAQSLPTFILMSREEVLLPSVELTALGHEIVHQWFGNSVFSDYDAGNWIEGFTIYFADHAAQEDKGRGWQCRRRIMSGLQSHVNENNDFPLVKFTEREDHASRVIGYGKSAMVVHMLRRLSGDEVFFHAIRDFIRENSFKVATWDDIRVVFEKHLKRDLRAFFSQWLERTGRPVFEILDMETSQVGRAYRVSFAVMQKTAPFHLELPVQIHYRGGVLKRTVTIDKGLAHFSFQVPAEPIEVVIDEEYDVLRALLPEENPPTFERILADENIIVLSPSTRMGRYREAIEALKSGGSRLKLFGFREGYEKRRSQIDRRGGSGQRGRGKGLFSEMVSSLSESELSASSLILLGSDNPVVERLFRERRAAPSSFSLTLHRNPRNPEKVVGVLDVPERVNVKDYIATMYIYPFYTHYTAASHGWLEKRLEASERGIRIGLESHD